MPDRSEYEIVVLTARYAAKPTWAARAASAFLYSICTALMIWLPLVDTIVAVRRGEPVLPALKFNFKCLWLAYVSLIA